MIVNKDGLLQPEPANDSSPGATLKPTLGELELWKKERGRKRRFFIRPHDVLDYLEHVSMSKSLLA